MQDITRALALIAEIMAKKKVPFYCYSFKKLEYPEAKLSAFYLIKWGGNVDFLIVFAILFIYLFIS